MNDPRPERNRPWSLLIGLVGAMALLWGMVNYDARAGEELALGNGTASAFAERGGAPIHIHLRADFKALVAGANGRATKFRVLWLGNSQLHAINQIKPGQEPAPALLFDTLKTDQIDVVTASFPNANLQEHYVATLKLIEMLPRVDVLLIPVVFDDFRETGIRADLAPLLEEVTIATSLSQTAIGKTILATAKSQETNSPTAARKKTYQDRSEEHLDALLGRHSSIWRGREQSRALIFSKAYELRNWAFRIDAQTKRPMIRARYDHNIHALEALVNLALARKIKPIVYVAPLRSDIETPYIESEYTSFKQDLKKRMLVFGAPLVDASDLVPGQFWGGTGDATQLDFMHFRYGGHKLLTTKLAQEIRVRLGVAR